MQHWAARFVMAGALLGAPATLADDARLLLQAAGQGHAFAVEVARTPQAQATGLMYRRSLPANAGMLFPYGDAQPITMWMRNTYIPLDMIFLRGDGTVVRIERDTEPLSERVISSGEPASAVLELNAGTAARIGLKEGDRAEHPIFAR